MELRTGHSLMVGVHLPGHSNRCCWHCLCFKHSYKPYKPTYAAAFLVLIGVCYEWQPCSKLKDFLSKVIFLLFCKLLTSALCLRSGFAKASYGPSRPSCRKVKGFFKLSCTAIWLLYNATSIRAHVPMLPMFFSQGQTVPYTVCPQRLPVKMCWS